LAPGGSGMTKKFVLAPLLALVIWAGAASALAADKNKCGCYKDDAGVCFCDKKAKCGCPGDCEPKGCDEVREKQLRKEIDAETKKAAQADRKHASADKSEDNAGVSRESKAASANGKLTPAQAKELLKLLDLYLAGHPDARTRNVEDVRKELSEAR
jgi:hypothetical protein